MILALLQQPELVDTAAAAAADGPSGPLSVLLLAIVQGLAEFLPISSSGHLTLGRIALGMKEAGLAFDVALHVGTLVAVVVAFWSDVVLLFRDLFAGRLRMWLWLIVATIPAGLAGVLLGDMFEAASHSSRAAAYGLFATSIALLLGERARRALRGRGGRRAARAVPQRGNADRRNFQHQNLELENPQRRGLARRGRGCAGARQGRPLGRAVLRPRALPGLCAGVCDLARHLALGLDDLGGLRARPRRGSGRAALVPDELAGGERRSG
jgi:hypothetical protein